RVWLGVRPEKVRLAAAGEPVPAGWNSVEAVVTDSCYAGVSTEYLLRAPWGQELSVFSANAHVGGLVSPGTAVTARWLPENSFVLDRPTGPDGEPARPAADPLRAAS
ncbi:MAG TPA: TOBE domain-containing protein, partial [Pilimelia sp.]|nr:TOBE domain-containing protein [Pilimelia sp.]